MKNLENTENISQLSKTLSTRFAAKPGDFQFFQESKQGRPGRVVEYRYPKRNIRYTQTYNKIHVKYQNLKKHDILYTKIQEKCNTLYPIFGPKIPFT